MRRAKKWLAGALAVLLLVNLLPASALAEEANAGEEPVVEQVETTPEGVITRAQLAELLYANERLKASIDSAARGQEVVSFVDIDNSCTPEQKTAISAMAQARVLNGTAAGIFAPDGTVTRAQAAVVLWRAAGCLSNRTSEELLYSDAGNIPTWAVAAVNCLYALGILDKTTADFRPNEDVTAEEMQAWLDAYDALSVETIDGIAVPDGTSRAEMLEIFYAAYKDALPSLPTDYTTEFDDIADCTANQKAVITLFHTLQYEEGTPIVVGVAERQFAPFAPVTNRQVAALLQRTILYIESAKSGGEAALSSFDGMELQGDGSGYDATLQFLMERGLTDDSADTIRNNPHAPGVRSNIEAWSDEVKAADDIVVTGDVAEVRNYAGFAAAVADEDVQSIRITGSVVIPAASTALDAGTKEITVCKSGSLTLAPGAVLTSSAPMGQFSYEDEEHLWTHIAKGMAAFLLWLGDNDSVYRELHGSQPENLDSLFTDRGSLNTAVFRDDVTLTTCDATIGMLVMMGEKKALTIQDKASLTIEGYLHVEDGSLHVLPGGSLVFGDEGEGWVNGDVEFRDGRPPEMLHWGGSGLWPHLVALEYDYESQDPAALRWGDFRSDLWMTPLDEPEVVFGFLYFDESEDVNKWQFDLSIGVTITDANDQPCGLKYQRRDNQEQRWYLSGAEWKQTYHITCQRDGKTYILPVYSQLPELGFYKAPEATEDNYINRFDYTPDSANEFYMCVAPNAWFMPEPGENVSLSYETPVYTGQGDAEGKISCQPVEGKTGVWKITVSGGGFWAGYRVDVLKNGEKDCDIWSGIDVQKGMYPHLVALWYDYDPESSEELRWGDYEDELWITPGDEPEVVFGFLYFDETDKAWRFDTGIELDLGGLTYEKRNDREGRMVLSGVEWDKTYTITYRVDADTSYFLQVKPTLPDLGFYSTPEVSQATYINRFEYTPDNNTFYLCVDPNALFMQEEGITLADPELVRGDPERVSCQPVKGKTGVWKITVTGWDFDIEYELRAFRGEEEVYWDRRGLRIEMGKYPHLVALDYDNSENAASPTAVNTDHYNDAISMAPGEEPELVFAFMYKEDGQWKFDTNIAVNAGDLTYEARNDRKGRMVLSGVEWDRTYNISYTAEDGKTYKLPVYVELPDLGFYSEPEVSRETYINRFDYTPLSPNEFYLCVNPNAWFMEDSECSLGELQLWNADGRPVSIESVGEGVWKITVYDCEFSVDFELPVLRNGNKEWSMGRGIWVSAGEQLVWSTQLLTEVTGESWDVDYDPATMQLSNTLTLYPGSTQDMALYLLVYYRLDEQNGHGKWVCEYTGIDWVRGEGVAVEGVEDSPLCRVTANAVGTQSIVRLDGREVITEEGHREYRPIPDSTRGIPLTVMVEERNLPVEIDWNARTARLTNEMDEAITVQMLLAAYDGDGRMCGVYANANWSLGVGESLKVTADDLQGKDVAKLKAFVLDPETHKPLCRAAEIEAITEPGTISGGTYQNLIITSDVGDGEVVLEDVTILGDLIIQGGGSSSIKLHACAVNGKVVLDKTTTATSTQQPRLELTETPVSRVVARQPAIIEAVDGASSVQEVKAAASVEIKGAKTAVDVVKALAPVTITAGKVNTVAVVDDKVPSGTQVAVTVGSGASVGEVAVHAAAGAAITNNGTIQAVSAADDAVASKITSAGTSATPAPAAHIHSWDNGALTIEPTCITAGQVTRTCVEDGCGAQKKTTVPALGHDYRTNFESDETGHWHVCDRCGGHGRKNAHVYGDDCICDICGYRNATVYPVFIRHTMEERGFVKDALVVANGEITVLGEAVGPNGELWIPPVRDGWSHKGWGIVVMDNQDERIFHGYFTKMTEELKRALLDAIDHGYRIFMDATSHAEGIGANGFSVTLDKSSGDLAYTLNVPGDGDDMYYLNLISMDRAEAYSCSVRKNEGYKGTVWALLPASGYYGAFEVMDANGKLVAASKDFPGFTAELNSGDLADCDKPVVTINYAQSDAETIVYEISGLTTMMNYQVADLDENGEGDVYFLGRKDDNGKVSLSTAVNNPLSGTVTLYGVAAFYINWYGMEIAKPITLNVPAYDPDHTGDADLKALVDEAGRLGLLTYADANSFAVDGQVTRLDASMLAAALMGLTPADAAGMTWPFTDGANLTADQKALIMLLAKEGVIAGYQDGSFGPEKILTNAQIVKILDRVLDHPVVPITRTNNLDPHAWYYLPFTMLDNIGVLDGTALDASMLAAARMQDVLRVCINAKNWRVQNPGNPEYPVSDLKFSGISLNWTAPALDSSLNRNELRYKVIMEDQYVSFESTTRENSLYLFDMVGGEYDRVIIRTYYGDRFCGQYETNALSITVQEEYKPAVRVSFTPNSDGSAYHVSINGMTPGVEFNLCLGEEVGNSGIGIGDTADAAGAFEDEISVQNFPELKDCVENGGFYLLREYPSIKIDSTRTTLEMTITNRGNWTPCDPGAYQVTDIRFEGQYLKWTEPAAVQGMNVHYRVELSKDGGQSWTEGCGSGEPQVAHYAFREGSYNKVRIMTEYNGNVLDTAYADISLQVSQKAMQSSGAQVSFKLVENGHRYEMTVTGLKPNTSHILSVMNRPWKWNERSFLEVVSDAQGTATVRFGDIELVEKGYYSVIELLDCSVPNSATAACGWAYLDVEGKCVDTCSHTVSNTKPVSNIRAQSSWIRWDASGANGDVYEIRLSEDGGQSWLVREFVDDGSTEFWSLDLPEGHYNAVQIRTLQRENCGCYVEVGKKLDTDFRLTVTEMAAATPAAVIFTPVNGVVDTYSFTITGLQPNGDYDLELAMDANGNQRRGGYGGPSADGSGKAVRENLTAWNGADFTMQDVLENGYYRLTEFKLDQSTDTLTRITHGTWTKSVIVTPTYRDTAWFEIKPHGSLYLCWDYTPMQNAADHADGYSLYLNFGTETNPDWRRVDGVRNGRDFVRINTPGIEEGVYTGVRLVGCVGSTETSIWFEQSCRLIITDGGASAAKPAFAANADGTYNVEVSGLDRDSQVAEVVVSGREGLGNIDYMVHEKEGNTSWLFEGEEISYPNGYYRIREYANLTAQGLTAGFSIAATGWTKVNDDAVTDTRTPVPAVTGFAFEESPVALWLRMQLPTDMNNIDCFRVEFRDINENWVDCGTCGGGMPIQGDRMNGTYNRIRITSIPKDDSQYQPGVYEDDCALTIANVQDNALSDVAFYSIANATPEPGYSVQVRGLEPDTKQVVVQLAERDNGDGRREELGGDNFFDENGTKGVSCTSFGSYLTAYFPGRYYRVLEVKDASVTDASTAYLKVKTRGGWSQITRADSLTYEPVTGLQLRNGGGYPELAWNNPTNQPIGARYQVFFSKDGGASWLGGSKTDMNFMKPYLYEQGTYNKVKVATVVNGMEVAASTLNINLQVAADAQTSNAQLQLKLKSVGGDEYLYEVTYLTPNTPFAVFFKNQDGTSKKEIGPPCSDSNGTFQGTLRLKPSALGYWYIQEFTSCAVTSSTEASCTVRSTGAWQPVNVNMV